MTEILAPVAIMPPRRKAPSTTAPPSVKHREALSDAQHAALLGTSPPSHSLSYSHDVQEPWSLSTNAPRTESRFLEKSPGREFGLHLQKKVRGPCGSGHARAAPVPPATPVVSRKHPGTAPCDRGSDLRSGPVVLPPLPREAMHAKTLEHFLDSILAWHPPQPLQEPEFKFNWSDQAAKRNLEILERHNFDVASALQEQSDSPLHFGSEFRPAELISVLCRHHPLWSNVRKWLTSGVAFPLRPISEDDRKADLAASIERGNHKGAVENVDTLTAMLQEEVKRGWQLILPIPAAHKIPDAVVAPLGFVTQQTISERGEIVDKNRLTHDQSMNPVRGTRRSVNNRVIVEELTRCVFGSALLRYIHFVIQLRQHHPTARILQTKVDWKAAYRRLHCSANTAVQSMVIIGGFLLMALRITFGGAPNPSRWSDLSELSCDLGNDLVRNRGWDPATHHSPHQHLIGDAVEFEDDGVPLAQAAPCSVKLPRDDAPKADYYIDDGFCAFLETDRQRGGAILPFIIHLLGRPVSDVDPLPRDDVLSLKKFIAEATPAEIKTILGWDLDTRRLLLSLPDNKVAEWSADIQTMIDRGWGSESELETLVGRLNHVGHIIPSARHFLSRLRHALSIAQSRGRGSKTVTFRQAQIDDLRLWLFFLQEAGKGISLNLITFREPTHIHRVDACEHGVGGYDTDSGTAWRWQIPPELRLRVSLNSLEFLAAYLSLAMAFERGEIPPGSCIVEQGDSTAASGWLHKSNFDEEDQPFQLWIARAIARLILKNKCVLYTAPGLSHLSASARAAISSDLRVAEKACEFAVTEGTHEKQNRFWRWYIEYLHSIELQDDEFLEGFNDWTKCRILAAFASAYRERRFRPEHFRDKSSPISSSCRTALDSVAATFRAHGHSPPTHDGQGKLHFFLQRMLRGFSNLDPTPKGQKALTPGLLRALCKIVDSEEAIATNQLTRGAFFFAMRSCEYLETSGERRTKRLVIHNIRFYKDRKLLPHSSHILHLADTVTITFEFQKNDVREESVTMHRSGDPVLCPCVAWSAVVRRVLSYPGSSPDSPVNNHRDATGKVVPLRSKTVLARLRAAAACMGEDALGFKPSDIGTHSIRSGAAMAMYLAGVPVFTIMLIGRWSSDAFLRYIRRQVQEFSSGISRKMILSPDFFTIPDEAPTHDPENPRTPCGRQANTVTGHGSIFGLSNQSRALQPAFALHY